MSELPIQPLRCVYSGNPCGTDTSAKGHDCACGNCLLDRHIAALQAQIADLQDSNARYEKACRQFESTVEGLEQQLAAAQAEERFVRAEVISIGAYLARNAWDESPERMAESMKTCATKLKNIVLPAQPEQEKES